MGKSIKDKLAAKADKINAKAEALKAKLGVTRKAAKAASLVMCLLVSASMTGCMTPNEEVKPAERAQSNNVKFELYEQASVNFYFGRTAATNDSTGSICGDMFCQEQAVESSGSTESHTATQTQTPTQTTSPQTTLTYAPGAGTTDALGSLASAVGKGITAATSSSSSATAKTAASTATSATCTDGSCSPGNCTDGSCSK